MEINNNKVVIAIVKCRHKIVGTYCNCQNSRGRGLTQIFNNYMGSLVRDGNIPPLLDRFILI